MVRRRGRTRFWVSGRAPAGGVEDTPGMAEWEAFDL